MKKEAGTSSVVGMLLILISIVLLSGCETGFREVNVTINRTYYDPFEIDQNALPKPLPPPESSLKAAHQFADVWSAHDYEEMYNLIDPFLQNYKTADEFSAMMAMNPGKYAAKNVTVINATVINHYQGKALFRLQRGSDASLLSMDVTFDEKENAAMYGFVEFFNTPLFDYVCGGVFNSSKALDLRTRQYCLYQLAYLSKSPSICSYVPNILLDHGECFNIRDEAVQVSDFCEFYLTCHGVLAHVTHNSSLCSFTYGKDIKRCEDGVLIAQRFDQNMTLPSYFS